MADTEDSAAAPAVDKIQSIRDIRHRMDTISPTLCLAKWYKTTIYLQTGQTHSCYHPPPHPIPVEGLAADPSRLHNTPQKQQERRELLAGMRPSGCQYCWNIEAMGGDYISDRLINSAYMCSDEKLARLRADQDKLLANPEFLELSFDNVCNLKCGYCHPAVSSRFMQEIRDFGPYSMVSSNRLDVDPSRVYGKSNPFLAAFWKWWPTLKRDLKILRITGGEPLLSKSTWKLLAAIGDDPTPDLELSINTNLSVSPRIVERLAASVRTLLAQGAIGHFKLYTSIDTWGAPAEYIRTGLCLSTWQRNLDLFVTTTHSPVELMSTFNILSVTTFHRLLAKILEWRRAYSPLIDYWTCTHDHKLRFETHYLTSPLVYDMNLLPKAEFMPYLDQALAFVGENVDDSDIGRFCNMDYEKLKRVVDYMRTTEYGEDTLRQGRRDFALWIDEHDRRRGTRFTQVFPEYERFYRYCKSLVGE